MQRVVSVHRSISSQRPNTAFEDSESNEMTGTFSSPQDRIACRVVPPRRRTWHRAGASSCCLRPWSRGKVRRSSPFPRLPQWPRRDLFEVAPFYSCRRVRFKVSACREGTLVDNNLKSEICLGNAPSTRTVLFSLLNTGFSWTSGFYLTLLGAQHNHQDYSRAIGSAKPSCSLTLLVDSGLDFYCRNCSCSRALLGGAEKFR